MARKRTKLKDVAALAETSLTTAARALNGFGSVSAQTRNRVLDAAERLNYRPNLQAKGLGQRSSRSIGLVIPNLLNPYYIALADAVSIVERPPVFMEIDFSLILRSSTGFPRSKTLTLRDRRPARPLDDAG
jgi:hypothetical protein